MSAGIDRLFWHLRWFVPLFVVAFSVTSCWMRQNPSLPVPAGYVDWLVAYVETGFKRPEPASLLDEANAKAAGKSEQIKEINGRSYICPNRVMRVGRERSVTLNRHFEELEDGWFRDVVAAAQELNPQVPIPLGTQFHTLFIRYISLEEPEADRQNVRNSKSVKFTCWEFPPGQWNYLEREHYSPSRQP